MMNSSFARSDRSASERASCAPETALACANWRVIRASSSRYGTGLLTKSTAPASSACALNDFGCVSDRNMTGRSRMSERALSSRRSCIPSSPVFTSQSRRSGGSASADFKTAALLLTVAILQRPDNNRARYLRVPGSELAISIRARVMPVLALPRCLAVRFLFGLSGWFLKLYSLELAWFQGRGLCKATAHQAPLDQGTIVD